MAFAHQPHQVSNVQSSKVVTFAESLGAMLESAESVAKA